MNERIQELMNQTGVPVSMPFDKWCEKFAELIVRECANLSFKDTGEVTTIGEIAVNNMILKHFGVKE
jgi:hypothetical protein